MDDRYPSNIHIFGRPYTNDMRASLFPLTDNEEYYSYHSE